MKDEEISLVYRIETEKNGNAHYPRPQTRRKQQRTTEKDPEKCCNPAIILRHDCKQVEPHPRFHHLHRLERHPAVNSVPIQPIRVQQKELGGNTDAPENAEQSDGNRGLRGEEEMVPGLTQLS